MKKLLPILFACSCPLLVFGQAITSVYAYKNLNTDSYVRVSYENDFFMASDEYYTQGLQLEFADPSLRKFPVSYLLIKPGYVDEKYSLSVMHAGYTPSSISDYAILRNDHPYAGILILNSGLTGIDPIKRQRCSSVFTVGVIGPAALAAEMQTGIHKSLNNVTPEGWHNQIRNDIAINYAITYEKLLLNASNVFLIDAGMEARAGTLNDRAAVGATMMLGRFHSPYSSTNGSNHFQLYVYDRPEAAVIAYDATLQGGLFNKTSPYTLDASEIEHTVFTNRLGINGTFGPISLEYFQTTATRSFKAGRPHSWGGIQLAINF